MLDEDDRRVHYSHTDLVGRLKTEEPDVAESIIREHLRSGKAHFLKVDSA
jgi:DNA-binding GntR family transcriptional regulator